MSDSDDQIRHANGNSSAKDAHEESGRRLRRSAFRALVQDFGPLW